MWGPASPRQRESWRFHAGGGADFTLLVRWSMLAVPCGIDERIGGLTGTALLA